MSKNTSQPNTSLPLSGQVEEAKYEAVNGLVAGVSHEINTPLGVNIGNCTLLIELLNEMSVMFEQGALDAETFAEFLATATDLSTSMLKNMRRASKLLTTFKQVAVKKTDEASLLEVVDIAELVNEFVAAYGPESQDLAIAFEVLIPPNVQVTTYPSVLVQIFTALTANTLTHGIGVGGNNHCTITISVAPAGDGYQLTFADNGVGVDAAILDKVFDPFFTTRRGAGNAGLGLSIVYNLVKQMLISDIHYESEPRSGFSISFKLHNLAPQAN